MNAETGSVVYDNLVLGDVPPLTDSRTLTSGEKVERGQLLKLGSGTALVAMDEYDSESDAHSVAATSVDATSGAAPIRIFTFAELSADVVAEKSGIEVTETLKNILWLRGIHLRETVVL